GDGDDVAGSALFHARQEALDRQEGCREVSVDGSMPAFLADLLEWTGRSIAATRIRDQDLHGAELLFDLPAHGLDVVEPGGIGQDLDRPPAGALDLGSHRREGRFIAAMDGDLCAMLREEP